MRSLTDIVDEAKDGGKPSYNELRYALIAYDALLTFAGNDVMGLCDHEKQEWYKEIVAREHFNRLQRALAKSPKEWLGKNNDPDNLTYQAGRGQSKRIYSGLQKKFVQSSADENEKL
jgi:hypothetical protein